MAVNANVTNTAQFSTVTAREIDFVTRFSDNWQNLQDILGIMKPIRKAPGTKLVSYTASLDGSALSGGDVAEGETIPFSKFKVVENTYEDITLGKYAKSVTAEAVAKYGADIAVEKTDEQFLVELQKKVLTDFYTFLKTGTLTGTKATFQAALASAKGKVLDKFSNMNKTVTDVVGFVNIIDVYDYLGTAAIEIQSNFGLQYVKDFMGYSTLFLLGDSYIPSGTVIAVPVENIDLYYIDPSDSDFAKLGLDYTVQGETNLLGFHVEGDYTRATGDCYALMGMKLWSEYLDGIAVITVSNAEG